MVVSVANPNTINHITNTLGFIIFTPTYSLFIGVILNGYESTRAMGTVMVSGNLSSIPTAPPMAPATAMATTLGLDFRLTAQCGQENLP